MTGVQTCALPIYGEATALYLSKVIKPLGVSVTRIARGLPADRQPGEGQRGDMDDEIPF